MTHSILWDPLSLTFGAVSDIMLWHWCSVSLQHALPASGPGPVLLLCYKAHNAPPWACSHTHAWNEKGHFFLECSDSTEQPPDVSQGLTLASCALVCFNPGPPGPCWHFTFAMWTVIFFTSGEGKLTHWQHRKPAGVKWEEVPLNSIDLRFMHSQQSNNQGVIEYIYRFSMSSRE